MPADLFETRRLTARHLLATDLPALQAAYGDADAMRWVGDGQTLSADGCKRWLEVTKDNYRRRGYGMSALVERASGEVIGFLGLVHPDGQAEAELKYALNRRFWGRGFATEAAAAMLAYGARAFGVQQVMATTAPENTASHNVLTKVGMQRAELLIDDDGSRTQVFRWSLASTP
jgi:ribosomal-protein-alanine N-acetyltransferase